MLLQFLCIHLLCLNVVTAYKIADGNNGDVAVDQYHRYKVYIEILRRIEALMCF